ncbi:MAG: hypothetical protein KIT81_09845 [Alphaproteobacteria bacterium]|nr:hypothetical protein [Alphaproteobacteria bacterium]
MPGLVKVLVLALLALGAWYGFRQFKRWQERDGARLRRRPANGTARGRAVEAEDMVQCQVCGTYVASRRSSACARQDCPYRQG